jgi:hypothetical protein
MISYKFDEKEGILTILPEGKLENQDFVKLSQAVDPFIEEQGSLRGLIIVTKTFPGWKDFSGMIEHMKFVRGHHREITKVALVSDSKIADLAESVGKHFIKMTIKHFPFAEEESARNWIAQA